MSACKLQRISDNLLIHQLHIEDFYFSSSNNALPKLPKIPICKKFNQAKEKVEKTLAKSAVLMFENGQCKSAVKVQKQTFLIHSNF